MFRKAYYGFRKNVSFKKVSPMFKGCIDNDFNPDMVNIYLADSFESGFVAGSTICIGAGLLIASGYGVYKLIKHFNKEE